MIRVQYKKNQPLKVKKRLKSKAIIRKKIHGTPERPRLIVFRSHKHIYAQLVDDAAGVTLAGVSSLTAKTKARGLETAKQIGSQIAKKAKSLNIKTVVFDRNGYVYHGRVKAAADGARSAGLIF